MEHLEFEPVGQTAAALAAVSFSIKAFEYLNATLKHSPASSGSSDESYRTIAIWVIVLPLAVAVHRLTDFLLLKAPLRFGPLRRLVSRTASIEGYWFQGVHSEEPYSIVCIEYVTNDNSYRYHGINFKPDLTRNAYFSSFGASVSKVGSGMTFHFAGVVHEWSGEKREIGSETAEGYGRINFFTDNGRHFIRGSGEFFEKKPEANWRTFEMYKIPRKIVTERLGKHHAVDDQDYELLLTWATIQRRKKRNALVHLMDIERLAMQYEGERSLLLRSRDSKEIEKIEGLERSRVISIVGDFGQYLRAASNLNPREHGSRGIIFRSNGKPIADPEIEDAELELGTRLPESYKIFLRTLGPGDWCEDTRILHPSKLTALDDTRGELAGFVCLAKSAHNDIGFKAKAPEVKEEPPIYSWTQGSLVYHKVADSFELWIRAHVATTLSAEEDHTEDAVYERWKELNAMPKRKTPAVTRRRFWWQFWR